MDELLQEFLAESRRDLDRLTLELGVLEREPGDAELVDSLFRTLHTLKGTSSCLGFEELESLARVGEGLVAELRDGARAPGRTIVERLLELAGVVHDALTELEEGARAEAAANAADAKNATDVANAEARAVEPLLPIERLWSRLPHLVRDLSRRTGKQARLEVHGAGLMLERGVIAALQAPLLHALRNSIDHGLELPAERIAAGKPPEGCLTLHARVIGGTVELEIADDGRGIALESVRATALARGQCTPKEAAALDERALLTLILQPGFSTRTEVNGLSGRGVGLDVVQTSVAALGGALELRTQAGRGTTLVIRLPRARA